MNTLICKTLLLAAEPVYRFQFSISIRDNESNGFYSFNIAYINYSFTYSNAAYNVLSCRRTLSM